MIPAQKKPLNTNPFATPPSKKLVSPKSISRKPSFVSFSKKRSTDLSEIKSSDRIRFISPSKANLLMIEDSIFQQNATHTNFTQYSENEPINYPFIKKCVSPRCFDEVSISRKSSVNCSFRQDNTFMSSVLSPSIQDFSNCDFLQESECNKRLLQQVFELKKTNFDLTLLIDEKNSQNEKIKGQYDARLLDLVKELEEIKRSIQISDRKLTEAEQKVVSSEFKRKELQSKLEQNNQKLDKVTKQVKMYKAKYKINFSNGKQKEDQKNRKYHMNCCKLQHQGNKGRNSQNICKGPDSCESKISPLIQSKKSNIVQGQTQLLKKIKSQNILPMIKIPTSLEASPQVSRMMKIHCNQQEFQEYCELKSQIQSLVNQIRYKDIEIFTLRRAKCDFQREKQNFEKTKKFNKKLLARVQFLTQQCDQLENNKKRLSLPSATTPKKKLNSVYEDFDQSEDEQQALALFQLSPQKNFINKIQGNDEIFEEVEMF